VISEDCSLTYVHGRSLKILFTTKESIVFESIFFWTTLYTIMQQMFSSLKIIFHDVYTRLRQLKC